MGALFRCGVAAACLALATALNCDAPSDDVQYINTFVIKSMRSFQQNGYQTMGSGACTSIRGNLRIQCSESDVAAANGGPIANLTFLSRLTSVSGYVHIEGCDDITTLAPLGGLETIGGSPNEGLYIYSCALLTDLKGVENLKKISQGGVTILKNNQLCYADLMAWDRIAVGTTSNNRLIHVLQMNSTCTSKQCDDSCFCGYCGGPGSCAEIQSGECEAQWYDPPDWVDDNEGNTVGYVILILFSTLLSFLFAVMLYGCIRKRVAISFYISAERPAPIEVAQFRPIVNRKLSMDVMQRRASGLSMSVSSEEAMAGDMGRLGGISPVIEDDADIADDAVTTPVAVGTVSPDSPTSEASDPTLTETFRPDVTQELGKPEADLAVEDSAPITVEEPAPIRPLKPFSNFLAVEKNTIDRQLAARRTVDPALTSQRVAAEMWQVDPAIQVRFKAEYETDMAVYEDFIGLATYKEQGNQADGWAGLPDPEKKSYVKGGLANEKSRRRAGRAARKSQINQQAILAMSNTDEDLAEKLAAAVKVASPPSAPSTATTAGTATAPATPAIPEADETPHRPLNANKRNKINPLVIQGEMGGAHDQKHSADPDSPSTAQSAADTDVLPPTAPDESVPEPPPAVPEEPDALPAPPPPAPDAEAEAALPPAPPAPAAEPEPEAAPAPAPAPEPEPECDK